MLGTIAVGIAAGAVGTTALDITTYLDMLVRGRPASEVPARTAEKLAAVVGISLEPQPAVVTPADQDASRQRAESRKSGLGALLGYVAGLGVGAFYGAIRPSIGNAPLPLTGLALATGALAAGDLPSVLSGTTHPREWGIVGWVSDIVPHLAYGFVTALAYEAFTSGELGRPGTRTRKGRARSLLP